MSNDVVERAYAFLRSHTCGDLRFDEHVRPIRYVFESDGRLVTSAMVAMLQSFDTVLFIPECTDGAMEAMVRLQEFKETARDGAAADRWRIYHGDPPDVRWAYLFIDAARYDGMVIDGEALMRTNPLAADEPRICRHMNQDHVHDLRRLCARYGTMAVEEPVMVGIDPLGIDVRARFDVVRVPTAEAMNSAADARRVLSAMCESCGKE